MTLPPVWIQTFTGKKFNPLNPDPSQIDICDIAHALSNQCRYAGHGKEFYSVAEHSVHVARELGYRDRSNPRLAFTGLMHDAAEAYLTDLPRPIKSFVTGFKEIEERLLVAIATKFGMYYPFPPELHVIDLSICLDEAAVLFNPEWVKDWRLVEDYQPLGRKMWLCGPKEAEKKFLAEFETLAGQV